MTADDMAAVRRQDPPAAAAIERWCQATLPSEVYDRGVSAITLGEGYVDVEMFIFDDHGELVMESFMPWEAATVTERYPAPTPPPCWFPAAGWLDGRRPLRYA